MDLTYACTRLIAPRRVFCSVVAAQKSNMVCSAFDSGGAASTVFGLSAKSFPSFLLLNRLYRQQMSFVDQRERYHLGFSHIPIAAHIPILPLENLPSFNAYGPHPGHYIITDGDGTGETDSTNSSATEEPIEIWGRRDGKVLRDVVIQGNFQVGLFGRVNCHWFALIKMTHVRCPNYDLRRQPHRRNYAQIFADLEAEIKGWAMHIDRNGAYLSIIVLTRSFSYLLLWIVPSCSLLRFRREQRIQRSGDTRLRAAQTPHLSLRPTRRTTWSSIWQATATPISFLSDLPRTSLKFIGASATLTSSVSLDRVIS